MSVSSVTRIICDLIEMLIRTSVFQGSGHGYECHMGLFPKSRIIVLYCILWTNPGINSNSWQWICWFGSFSALGKSVCPPDQVGSPSKFLHVFPAYLFADETTYRSPGRDSKCRQVSENKCEWIFFISEKTF